MTEPLPAPPPPRFEDDWEWCARDYVPLSCVLHPERVVEYPHPCNLPVELAQRIEQ